jgi:anaerobic carbon-monoxide dehydrogenase iron sulfur subunit
MPDTLHIDAERCTGCTSCMLACSFAKAGTHAMHLSRIRISRDEEIAEFQPKVCRQCRARACIAACPVNALTLSRETEAVLLEAELCIGCEACVAACPYDALRMDTERRLPLVCDLCGGSPSCVEACRFPRAIWYGEDPPS